VRVTKGVKTEWQARVVGPEASMRCRSIRKGKKKVRLVKICKASAVGMLHQQCPQWAWALCGDAWLFEKGEMKAVLE
jgi:hypothetical protein